MMKIFRGDRRFRDRQFPLAVMRSISQHPLAMHAHQFSELVIVSRGTGIHATTRDVWPVAAVDVFVIAGAQAHEYRDAEGLVLSNILFDQHALSMPEHDLRMLPGYHALFRLEPSLRARGRFRGRLKLPMTALTHAETLVDKIEGELVNRMPGCRFMALAGFMELAGYLSRRYHEPASSDAANLLHVGKAVSYLENHYAEPLRLDDVARAAHLSKRHLLRRFKEATGLTPGAYLMHVRVARGAERLRGEDHNVSEAAWAVGFEDSNYFSRQFRRLMGISPRDYRKHWADRKER